MFGVREREAGNKIDWGYKTKEECETIIAWYEKGDKEDGLYTPDFYEVYECDRYGHEI